MHTFNLSDITLNLSNDSAHLLVCENYTSNGPIHCFDLTIGWNLSIDEQANLLIINTDPIQNPMTEMLPISDRRNTLSLDIPNNVLFTMGIGIATIDNTDPINIRILSYPLAQKAVYISKVGNDILFSVSQSPS